MSDAVRRLRELEHRKQMTDDRTLRLVLDRLERHVERIAARDWDYFAGLRYRDEGTQAVSDVWRLRHHLGLHKGDV